MSLSVIKSLFFILSLHRPVCITVTVEQQQVLYEVIPTDMEIYLVSTGS